VAQSVPEWCFGGWNLRQRVVNGGWRGLRAFESGGDVALSGIERCSSAAARGCEDTYSIPIAITSNIAFAVL
jgi:hypothetical protein